MVIFAIVLATIGLIILPLGKIYLSIQRKKDVRFSDPIYIHKFEIVLRLISICIFSIGLYLVYSML